MSDEMKAGLVSDADSSSAPVVELLVMPGSQFVMKAMAALDHLGVAYSVRRVNPRKLKQELPPPHLVPVMVYNGEVIPDSHAILVYLNERHGKATGKDLFPDARVTDAFESVEALETWSGDFLNVWSLWYSWGDDEAWKRSLRPVIAKQIPAFLQKCCPCLFGVDNAVRPIRERQQRKCHAVLGDALATTQSAEAGLAEALGRLESSLKDDGQAYLLGTEQPTAGDFAVYGNVLRIVDTSFDANIGAGLPGALDRGATPRLRAWFLRMKEAFPLQFYGRGKPKKGDE